MATLMFRMLRSPCLKQLASEQHLGMPSNATPALHSTLVFLRCFCQSAEQLVSQQAVHGHGSRQA
jgi:hypothetical protein